MEAFVDVVDLCRICLGDEASIPIFGNVSGEWEDVSEKLALCFSEKLSDLYGYPRNICKTCYHIVTETVTLINKFKESQQVLQKALENSLSTVKQEYIENCNDDFQNEDILYVREETIQIKQEPIKFDNAEEFLKIIKPLADKVNSHTKSKRKHLGLWKNDKTNKKEIKKKLKNKANNKVIACAILEGEFEFNGQWCLRSPTKKENDNTPNKIKNCIPPKRKSTTSEPQITLCEQCGASFDCSSKLRKHIKSAHEPNVTCSICQKELCDPSRLKQHIAQVHSEKKICTVCGAKLANAKVLRQHIKRIHLGEKSKPKKRNPCNICPKTYANKKALLIHQRSEHTGERPAICNVCGSGFFGDAYLREHMRLHTGETPYKCPICNRGYAQKGNMKSHIRHNHKLSDLDEATLQNLHPRFLKHLKPEA